MQQAKRRVGAILSWDKENVHLLGYGVYEGDHTPDDGFLHEAGIKNPKITLDDGRVVWGYQCWWGDEDKIKEKIGNRNIINATIGD